MSHKAHCIELSWTFEVLFEVCIGGDVRDRTAVLKQIMLASTCLEGLINFTR